MIYTDGIHLVGTTAEELHRFAEKIKLKRCWFKSHIRHPHYDLMLLPRSRRIMLLRALKAGAIAVTAKHIVRMFKERKLYSSYHSVWIENSGSRKMFKDIANYMNELEYKRWHN